MTFKDKYKVIKNFLAKSIEKYDILYKEYNLKYNEKYHER